MPKLQRSNIPEALLDHLLDRVFRRGTTEEELYQILHWVEGNPTVPEGDWFK